MVDARLGMEVPDGDGGYVGGGTEVDLHPLRGWPELHVGAVRAGFVTVGNEGEFADDGERVTAGDGFSLGEIDGAGGNHEVGTFAGAGLLEVGKLDGAGSAGEEWLGQLQFERNLVRSLGRARERDEGEEERQTGTFHGKGREEEFQIRR